MRRFDIREYKTKLREKYKRIRQNMSLEEKAQKDGSILEKVTSLPAYQKAKWVLVYVSTSIEVDTHRLIERSWKEGKKVAVPRCIDGTRNMHFYEIEHFDQLEPRTFGVLEPVPSKAKQLTRFKDAVCIVPGLSFDNDGYRLGYGKGYYDRFLSTYCRHLPKVGVCYRECIRYSLHHSRYDVACGVVVNDQYIRYVKKKKRKQKGPHPEKGA